MSYLLMQERIKKGWQRQQKYYQQIITDLQGRKIHEEEITDDVTSVDASGWQSGTYIWKLGIRNEELGIKEVEEGKWVKL